MKTALLLTFALVSAQLPALAQPHPFEAPAPLPYVEYGEPWQLAYAGTDPQNDPARSIYKEAYNLLLDEQWEAARAKFSELLLKYKKSAYRDAAEYWSASALKHIDKKNAVTAYSEFLKHYPSSKYYDGAVADLSELERNLPDPLNRLTVKGNARVFVDNGGLFMTEGGQKLYLGEEGVVIGEGPDSLVVGKGDITIKSNGKNYRYGYSVAPQARSLERALRLQVRRLSAMSQVHRDLIALEPADKKMQLKLSALYALGQTREDDASYQTLKDVAQDTREHPRLRLAALEALSEFKKYDVMPIFVQIAKNDTIEDMQYNAITYITEHGKDKGKTVGTLIDIFTGLPEQRQEERQSIFYAIGDIGTDRAVDFFASIARTSDDYDLRQDAIYYLGSIGGERARAALYDILKSK
jgi:hypothetical protein